jgi:hypothetical protein
MNANQTAFARIFINNDDDDDDDDDDDGSLESESFNGVIKR